MSSLIVPATVATAVITNEAVRVISKKPPSMKPVIGGFILGIGLYAIQGLDERLGTLFCILIIVASLLNNGPTLFPKLGGIVK